MALRRVQGPTDEALMERASAGDMRALALLYDRHATRLFNFFVRRIGNVERAEELTHDVFLALLGLRGRYRARAPFVALLYGIARKLLGKEYRRLRRTRGIGTSGREAGMLPGREGWTETGYAVREALERLPVRLREPLMLFVYERLSYEEIAHVLGRPVGTVRSRIARARRALAELLAKEGS